MKHMKNPHLGELPLEYSFDSNLPKAIREALSCAHNNSKVIYRSNAVEMKIRDKILRELKEREKLPKFKTFDLGEHRSISIEIGEI